MASLENEAGNEKTWSFKDDFWFNVTFICHQTNASEIYLMGDFNGWQKMEKYRMNVQENHVYKLTLLLSEGYYHYKFLIDGKFVRDTANPHVEGTYNNSIMFVHMDPKVYLLKDPVLPLQRGYARPGWNGKELIHEAISLPRTVAQFGLLERPVFVYLPLSYYTCPEMCFPTVYAHDGQNLFSTTENLPWGGWYLDEKLDSWWLNGVIPEFILVSIPNSDYVCIGNRQKEYTTNDILHIENEPYVQYLLKVIKPTIDNRYRTLPGASDTFVLGASLGGLMSFLLAVSFSNVFSCGISLSPAFWFIDSKNQNSFTLIANNDYPKACRLYIDSGDGEGDNKELVSEMALLLKDSNYSENFMYYYDQCKHIAPFGVTHSESAWRNRILIGLKFAFKIK